jgi:hypothetical protein
LTCSRATRTDNVSFARCRNPLQEQRFERVFLLEDKRDRQCMRVSGELGCLLVSLEADEVLLGGDQN